MDNSQGPASLHEACYSGTNEEFFAMAYIRQIDEAEAEGRLKRMYEGGRGRAGYVANIIKVMGLEPHAAQASMYFYTTLMKTPNALEPARREMLAAVVSNINDCYY